jgi:HlyD family secretion protein
MKRLIPLVLVAAIPAAWWYTSRPPTELVLTGIITTDEIIVAPQIQGRIDELKVAEGDVVQKGQLLATLAPDELREERAFYSFNAESAGAGVAQSVATLRWEEKQTADQIIRAEANLAAVVAKHEAATVEADRARTEYERAEKMWKQGIGTAQLLEQTRGTYDVARAQVASAAKQVDAEKAAVALARSNLDQVAIRRTQLAGQQKQQAAAEAQQSKASVRLAYTELHAPIAGIVDTRAARQGEIVTPGDAVVTLIDPDNLWVRADVEETYIDRVKIGDPLQVRLPSGDVRQGTVTYRGVDAGFATQRDVSRTKRDIRTFEIRLKIDNADRRLATGMTAYVLLPVARS